MAGRDRPRVLQKRATFVDDPITSESAELRKIQPYEATKAYRCPGCNQEIALGVAHVVIVPLRRTDDRRHWHESCWNRRDRLPAR